MTIKDIIFVILVFGALGMGAILGLTFLFYLVYTRILKREIRVRKEKILMYVLLYTYVFVVLCATVILRHEADDIRIHIQPFIEYRAAWYNFSMIEWKNIVLNILMFVPFGIMFPVIKKKYLRLSNTMLLSLTFTLNIKLVYTMDSKGFLQPEYHFEAETNKSKREKIIIPARL